MKLQLFIPTRRFARASCIVGGLLLLLTAGKAQDSTEAATETTPVKKVKPVKNTFPGIWIIDNQTVMVPVKGTMEMDIQHRFGTVNKGSEDLWGIFAPSNIRLGMGYAPINRLFVGMGITKETMLLDLNGKYSIITQTKGKYPVSVTYYGNLAYDTRKDPVIYDGSSIKHWTDRFYFFHELIIARKVTDRLSLQVAPTLSHQNAVSGYYTKNDSTGKEIFKSMKNTHFAFSVAARFKLTEVTSLIMNYDQPLTKHATNNPNPNLAFGFEFNTSNHSFQVFLGNFSSLSPQRNNLFNHNDPLHWDRVSSNNKKGGNFLIGFNITRLWNY